MYRELLDARLAVLKQQKGVEVRALNIGEPVDEKDAQNVSMTSPSPIAAPILDFYREMDGLELSWSIQRAEGELFGSIIVLPLKQAVFGYDETMTRKAYPGAFEDVLWYEESYEPKSIKELKTHRVFESIEGEPAFVTFKPPDGNDRLYYVYEEDIRPLIPGFQDYVKLVFHYVGAGPLRGYLTERAWEEKLQSDQRLAAIDKWPR